jgi:pimeloyl-ACP methyl ester carboxylesterase
LNVLYKANDVRLHYEVRGSGPDVLFMHGLAADRHQAGRCLRSIAGFRVITVDMPGHGDSLLSEQRGLPEQVGFRTYANVAGDLLRSLGSTSAHVGGISMGAGVALALALADPERVNGLLLIRPAWVSAPARPHLDLLADIGEWIEQDGANIACERLVADRRFEAIRDRVPVCAEGLLATIERSHVRAAPMVLPTMVDDRPYQSDAVLAGCATPTLVVSGDDDPLHPRWVADRLAMSLPDTTARVVPPRYLEPAAHVNAVGGAVGWFFYYNTTHHKTNHQKDTTGEPT